MPLVNEDTNDYICYICQQSYGNIRTLHRHHVSAHTSEELSLAMISLNGWTFSSTDVNVFEGSVDTATCDEIREENDLTETEVMQTLKQSKKCVPKMSLAPTRLTDDAPVNVVPFYNESSSFKLSDVPLDMSILHNNGIVSEISVKSVENAQSIYDLNNSAILVAQEEKHNTVGTATNAKCDQSTSAISSDDFSGSETETDIEVNGSGRLFDSDYEIKIDIFDEYEDLEIEDGSRPISPNIIEESSSNLTVVGNSGMKCSNGTVLALTNTQKKAVKEECINHSTASAIEILNNTHETEIMTIASDKNCPLACTSTQSHRNNQSVDDISKVSDEHSVNAASKQSVVESSKPIGCKTAYSDVADSVDTMVFNGGNCTLNKVLVPLVEISSAECVQGNCSVPVTDTSTVQKVDSLHRNSTSLHETPEKEELENIKIYCAAKSVCNTAHKLKVERLDEIGLTFCTSTSEIVSSQIMRNETVPIYRCAITCVARSGGFFKAKVDPGPLKDAAITKVAERRFFCESCGKGYKKKSHLERHLRAHTGERPFQCSYCTKRFAVRSILKQHVRIHTGEKPYCCSVCLQRFPQKSGLMTHMMLHTGKPFKCDLCEKSFVSNHKLLQHLKSHESQNIYSCSECKTKFFTEGALREHGKIHSETKLECPAWQVDFLQKDF